MNIHRLLLFVTLAVRVSATTTTSGTGIGTSTDTAHPNENTPSSRPPSYSSYSTGTLPFPKEPPEKVSAKDHTTSNVNANAGGSSGPGPGPRNHDSSTHSDPTHPTHSTHSSTPGSSNTSPEGPGSPRYELSPPPRLEPFDEINGIEQGLGPTRSSHPSPKDRAVRCLVVYGCPTCVMVLGFGAILGIGFGLAASQSGPPCPGPWDMLMNGSYESGGVGGNWTGCNLTNLGTGTGMVTGIRMRKRGVGGKKKEDEGMCGVDENTVRRVGTCDCDKATGTIGPDGKIHPLQGGDGKHTKREVLKSVYRKRTTTISS
ncbi:hypothetical protein FB446DRAFT_782577 [Lentinula raphanica]|nr:hypothetical protein FB446DRAFT_782577 [Lentinula raphanica]